MLGILKKKTISFKSYDFFGNKFMFTVILIEYHWREKLQNVYYSLFIQSGEGSKYYLQWL